MPKRNSGPACAGNGAVPRLGAGRAVVGAGRALEHVGPGQAVCRGVLRRNGPTRRGQTTRRPEQDVQVEVGGWPWP